MGKKFCFETILQKKMVPIIKSGPFWFALPSEICMEWPYHYSYLSDWLAQLVSVVLCHCYGCRFNTFPPRQSKYPIGKKYCFDTCLQKRLLIIKSGSLWSPPHGSLYGLAFFTHKDLSCLLAQFIRLCSATAMVTCSILADPANFFFSKYPIGKKFFFETYLQNKRSNQ